MNFFFSFLFFPFLLLLLLLLPFWMKDRLGGFKELARDARLQLTPMTLRDVGKILWSKQSSTWFLAYILPTLINNWHAALNRSQLLCPSSFLMADFHPFHSILFSILLFFFFFFNFYSIFINFYFRFVFYLFFILIWYIFAILLFFQNFYSIFINLYFRFDFKFYFDLIYICYFAIFFKIFIQFYQFIFSILF